VRAALRRVRQASEPAATQLKVGPLVIDPARYEARIGETRVPLTLTEFQILHLLASHPGRVFTREQVLDRVMGREAGILDRNVDVHVRGIRKKLGDNASLIETVRGVGYRIADDAG
jgi:DNA-binding response OmpR family regulator